MKEIPLTRGKVALVDDEDYEFLSQWKWFAKQSKPNGDYYAARTDNVKRLTIRMHREILGLTGISEGDHKNRNTLDNQRHNLRPASRQENRANCVAYSTSGYKGVTRRGEKWEARIGFEKQFIYLGIFSSAFEAARIYDNAARILFGQFARTNF